MNLMEKTLIKKIILLLFVYITISLSGCAKFAEKANKSSVTSEKTKELLAIANGGDGSYKIIKKLVEEGAETKNIVLPAVWYKSDFECNSVLFILKRNLHLYQNKGSLNSKPKGALNPVDSPLRREDLALLADTADGKSICNKSIKLLVRSNPKLRNVQTAFDGSTVLHQYISDTSHPQWSLDMAKLLISPQNINIQTYDNGNTPLHTLVLDSHKPQKTDILLVKHMIQRGANLLIKNKYNYNEQGRKVQGASAKDLITKKRPDLISALKI
jgi:hypothetical protein